MRGVRLGGHYMLECALCMPSGTARHLLTLPSTRSHTRRRFQRRQVCEDYEKYPGLWQIPIWQMVRHQRRAREARQQCDALA